MPSSSSVAETAVDENSPATQNQQAAADLFAPGCRIWLPHPKLGFVPGQVPPASSAPLIKGHPGQVLVENATSQASEFFLTAAASSQVERMDGAANASPQDLTDLDQLNNASLLNALHLRFAANQIYTSIGNVLVSTNPYKPLPLYSAHQMETYMERTRVDHAPHIYKVAARAYQATKSQTIVFSGESGSGKTEATKIFLGFLAHASEQHTLGEGNQDAILIRQRLLEANPLVEAFGNAQTLRNHNSSRFGTHLHVSFDRGVISGARLENLLLEKTRVIHHGQGERNFHIFYQVASMHLVEGKEFRYIKSSELRPESDAKGLEVTLRAMTTLGIEYGYILLSALTQPTSRALLTTETQKTNAQRNPHFSSRTPRVGQH